MRLLVSQNCFAQNRASYIVASVHGRGRGGSFLAQSHLPTPNLDPVSVQLNSSEIVTAVAWTAPRPLGMSGQDDGAILSGGYTLDDVIFRRAILVKNDNEDTLTCEKTTAFLCRVSTAEMWYRIPPVRVLRACG